MAKYRLRNWILNNPFFHYHGEFSKSAFIAMNTWIFVLIRYMLSGLNFTISTAERTIQKIIIPATKTTWIIDFPEGASIALLTTCFALYFGGKFSPDAKANVSDRRDLVKENRNDNSQEGK